MQDIHPIRPPVMVGLDPAQVKLLLLIAGGICLLALVVFLIRRFWKARSHKPVQELIPIIPPYDAALGELDRLCRQQVIDAKAFYFDLGALIKRYIGRSYSMNAVEMTTQELVKKIRITPMDKALASEVSLFLSVSDPFRYGPVAPDPSQVKQDLALVRQLITQMEQDLESRQPKEETL